MSKESGISMHAQCGHYNKVRFPQYLLYSTSASAELTKAQILTVTTRVFFTLDFVSVLRCEGGMNFLTVRDLWSVYSISMSTFLKGIEREFLRRVDLQDLRASSLQA